MTIFISLAAFCEPHLAFTLDHIFEKAKNPSALFVGLVDQSFDDNRRWLSEKPYWPNIRYVQFSPIESRGVSWARSIAFSLYEGEDYLLQIDSHSYFEQDWDEKLLEQMRKLLQLADKPILTTYPPPFEFDDNDRPFLTITPSNMVSVLRKKPDSELSDTSATLLFRVEYEQGDDFQQGYHVAGGFIFTLGRFVEEVPYDPFLYFHGEEQNLALRAFTHGWTIFHPRQSDVPLYHLYKQRDNSYVTHHWNDVYESQRQIKWVSLKARAEKRLLDLVSKKMAGVFGLGHARDIEAFIDISKIDYRRYF